jgi:predicted ATPase
MRVQRLTIQKWRNLESITIEVPLETTLVCLVGENGTGKSNVLELLAGIAHRVGISPGIQTSRGDPFAEPYSVEAAVRLTSRPQDFLPAGIWDAFKAGGHDWTGELIWSSTRDDNGRKTESISAVGAAAGKEHELGTLIVNTVRGRQDTHHLYLDADRSYPQLQLQPYEYAEGLFRNWDTVEWKRNRAFLPTRNLYEDWIKYFLAKENQQATQHLKEIRAARDSAIPEPKFVDQFLTFKETLSQVLPHLHFEGVDSEKKTIVLDSAGVPLNFVQLSGGEREIAFLIGQIDRFGLRQGLLLVDEPELHLNPGLVRNWVAFLRDTIVDGQVWIATHSMEAVEVAGLESTYVLERQPDSRVVKSARSLRDRPIIQILSAALGAPAFALDNQRFVFVEGERTLNERERYQRIIADSQRTRFIEGGNCRDVNRKVEAVMQVAAESNQPLHIGGIIDKDFRTDAQIKSSLSGPVLALPCHEIENLFLEVKTLERLLERSGRKGDEAQSIIQAAADKFAGAWIQQRAFTVTMEGETATRAVRERAWNSEWNAIAADPKSFINEITMRQALPNPNDQKRCSKALEAAIEEYRGLREKPDLWKWCMGKQSLGIVAKTLGFSGADFLEKNMVQLWQSGEVETPSEVLALRKYIENL